MRDLARRVGELGLLAGVLLLLLRGVLCLRERLSASAMIVMRGQRVSSVLAQWLVTMVGAAAMLIGQVRVYHAGVMTFIVSFVEEAPPALHLPPHFALHLALRLPILPGPAEYP